MLGNRNLRCSKLIGSCESASAMSNTQLEEVLQQSASLPNPRFIGKKYNSIIAVDMIAGCTHYVGILACNRLYSAENISSVQSETS